MVTHVGEKYDDMVITERVENSKSNKIMVKVECAKCGRTKVMQYHKFKNGIGTSHQYCANQVTKCKHFHDKWLSMRRRTTNPNCERYEQYGGRGISSDYWKFYIDFYDDMYESYLEHVKKFGKKDTTLERIDVNGDYCKENCTWVTYAEQQSNTQKNILFKAISPEGKVYISKNQQQFAKEHNLMQCKISECIHGHQKSHRGWKFYAIITSSSI